MGLPWRQGLRLVTYIAVQRLRGRRRFPLLVELEPLFACNLSCPGCGKIQHPTDVLRARMSVEVAVAAIEECGAPMVSIAGGEPLIHPEIHLIVAELLRRRRFVFLCTNGVYVRRRLHQFRPSPYFTWVFHVDGIGAEHDRAVAKEGVYDEVVAAIAACKERGFRVATNTTVFSDDDPAEVRRLLDTLTDELGVDAIMVAPGYAYETAPDQEHFLGVEEAQRLFRAVFAGGRRRWPLNHTPLYLDLLEGRVDLRCTAWAIPSYSVFGWQRPCYLLADGYARTYQELIETTDWEAYGRGRDPRCANCLAHCGYEPSAVMATLSSPRQMLRAAVEG